MVIVSPAVQPDGTVAVRVIVLVPVLHVEMSADVPRVVLYSLIFASWLVEVATRQFSCPLNPALYTTSDPDLLAIVPENDDAPELAQPNISLALVSAAMGPVIFPVIETSPVTLSL